MKAWIVTITLAAIVTIGTFAVVDWVQEEEPRPVAYCEKLVRWIGGIKD